MAKQRTKRHTVQRTCKRCGEAFFARQDQVDCGKGIFCGDKCSRKARRQPRVQRTCERCGKAFVAKQSDIDKGQGRFCSRVCHLNSPKRPKVQRTCKRCGTEFFAWQFSIDRGGGLFCSSECSQKASKRPRVRRACKQCGKRFLAKQDHVDIGKAIYCSPKCSTESQKRPNPVIVCQCCGKVFTDPHRNKRKYCSHKCYHESRPKAIKVPHSGRNYEHEKWVLAVLRRDRKCVRCGVTENLQSHHLKSWKDYPDLRYDVSNGAALCPLCHHAQHQYLPLERFIASGGKTVKHCVVCENVFIVHKKSQRTCSWKCGGKLRSQQKAAMGRRPA